MNLDCLVYGGLYGLSGFIWFIGFIGAYMVYRGLSGFMRVDKPQSTLLDILLADD
jgi:hypothetical protein